MIPQRPVAPAAVAERKSELKIVPVNTPGRGKTRLCGHPGRYQWRFTMSDQTKTEDFTKSLRSSATLLLRTLDRLQYDYSEASAGELSERISFLAELDRLENREAPIPMAYLRERVRLLQAYEKLNDWSIRDLKNRALSERIALLKELKAVGDLGMTEQQIKDRIRAIRDIRGGTQRPRGVHPSRPRRIRRRVIVS
jgi:hypothetical protein